MILVFFNKPYALWCIIVSIEINLIELSSVGVEAFNREWQDVINNVNNKTEDGLFEITCLLFIDASSAELKLTKLPHFKVRRIVFLF